MSTKAVQLRHQDFQALFRDHPDLDLLTHDFFAKDGLLQTAAEHHRPAAAELLTWQRLLRVVPFHMVDGQLHDAETVAGHLLAAGYRSAHSVARRPIHRFLRDMQGTLTESLAREVHHRSSQVRAATRHLFANARDLAGSPLTNRVLPRFAEADLVDYLQQLPSYQSLFGSLDYIKVPACASIFSPAAYFLDIMRIADEYITDYNRETIPAGYLLEDRRPDLFDGIKLSCEETERLIPYVSLVLQIFVAKLTHDLNRNPYQVVSTAPYPFNLPFSQPLTDISAALQKLNSSLSEIGQCMLANQPLALGYARPALARAAMGWSPEQAAFLCTVDLSDAAIGAQYGVPGIAATLPAPGPGSLTFLKDGVETTGADGRLGDVVHVGQNIACNGQIRVVAERIDSASIRVDLPWVEEARNQPWTLYGFPINLCDAQVFRHRTGGMSYQDLVDLFTQQLSPDEQRSGIADSFFINRTDENLPPLKVVPGVAEKGNVAAQIAYLSAKRLDRLSRFIRLSRWSGIAPTSLDWLIQLSQEGEITEAVLQLLAGVKQLADRLEWSVERTAALIGPFKTSGRGDGRAPVDPFDLNFNPPALLAGRDPHISADPMPFDPSRPLAWLPDDQATEGALISSSEDKVVLDDRASPEEGYYNGLQIVMKDGPAAGSARIIKSYDGASRTAILYAKWDSVPTTGNRYRIQNAVGLTDRLAAALQVKKTDLAPLGLAYRLDNGVAVPALLLTVETLTGLWRLGSVAWQHQLPVESYLLARQLVGLNSRYQPRAGEALADIQRALDGLSWQATIGLTSYELAYVLIGLRSRYVRPAFDPRDVPAILTDLASSAKSTRLSAQSLQQAGFDPQLSNRLFEDLQQLGVVDTQGLMRATVPAFDQAAASFPVTVASLTGQAGLNDAEAAASLATLSALSLAVLRKLTVEAEWAITRNYPQPGSLETLLQNVPDGEQKRSAVGRYLTLIADCSNRQLLAPLFPLLADTSFVGPGIGAAQSRAVFNCLTLTNPAVIVSATEQRGDLSARYDSDTQGWNLFESAASGQKRAVATYDPASRVLTVVGAWVVQPDAFSYFLLIKPLDAGQAQNATRDSLTLAATASGEDGAYVGYTLVLTDPAAGGETRTIVGYDGSSKAAVVSPPWTKIPSANATYLVGGIRLQGSADGGGSDTVLLPVSAATDANAYAGCEVLLVPDPDAAGKTTGVRMVLDALRRQIVLLKQTLDSADAAQQAAAVGGIGGVLAVSGDAVVTALPFASSHCMLPRFLIEPFLGGDSAEHRVLATEVLEGLSRFGLLQDKLAFPGEVWIALARQPGLFNVAQSAALQYGELQLLTAFKGFAERIGDDGSGLARYLEQWTAVVPLERRLIALQQLTGWQPSEIQDADRYLQDHLTHYAGLAQLAGVLRLAPMFVLASRMAADIPYLASMADVVLAPPLGAVGGPVDPVRWQALEAAASTTLSVVAVRFATAEFSGVADQLRRSTDSSKRDALLDFLIWHLNSPAIKSPSDLLQYLLIDVETSCCDTTTPIAQAIPSVQLYMQRCRMSLEPGVTVAHIPPPWWQWMSTYRLWEANRRIFLYPENYLLASQRQSATPQFKELEEKLLQARPTEQAVARALTQYFTSFETLTELVPVGGYKAGQLELPGGQIDETTVLVGRSNTSPYKYYLRTFTRSLLAEVRDRQEPVITQWGAWQNVGASIDAEFVTPVWAFDRPFLFWNEVKPTKSSSISTTSGTDAASSTQSTWQATLKYTFPSSTGDWLAAQELMPPTPIRVAPNSYGPANNENVAQAYANIQHYWKQPFALAIPRGLPGTGTLTFTAGSTQATGSGTRLDKQVFPGDSIYVAGQQLQVHAIDAAAQTLVTKQAFRLSASQAPFNVILKDPQRLRYSPYQGPGTVKIVSGINIVDGQGTAFRIDFSPGDFIQIGNETRVVASVRSDSQLLTTKDWNLSTEISGNGRVTLYDGLEIVDGIGTSFINQAIVGGELIALNQSRRIVRIKSDKQMFVDTPFVVNDTVTTDYKLGVPGSYTVLPRAEGNERLLVLYGPNLATQTDYGALPPSPPSFPNVGDDPYIAALQQFNSGIYSSLNLLQIIKNSSSLPKQGEVTGQKSLLLNNALVSSAIRLYNPVYRSSVSATAPVNRLGVDRENSQLFGGVTDRQMIALYWGNSSPGTTANQDTTGNQDRVLLHHISPSSAALLGIGNQIGWYLLNNNSDYFLLTQENDTPVPVANGTVLRSFWQPSASNDLLMENGPYSLSNTSFSQAKYRLTRLSTSVSQPLKQRLFVSINRLLALDSQYLQESPINQYFKTPDSPPPSLLDAARLPPNTMDFSGANGLYFWEIFYHAPMLVAEWLVSNQDYENAKRWFEYVFNPTASGDAGQPHDGSQYWQFRPFRDGMDLPSLKEILTNTVEINLSNNKPFDPDAIASLRISAYAKVAVLKYVDNLIKWADALFTQDTRESINQATNLYIMARDLLGETPQVVGVFQQPEKLTYNEIKAKYPDGIPQYLIDLENTPFLPASGQGTRFHDVPVNDIHAYFGVPDNEDLKIYWDTIDDRLYKIRHCMNINGVVRQLALFAPPIDPKALLASFGNAGSLSGGATGMPYPIPNYRFSYLIQMARSLADQVSRFGGAMLDALARQDGEALAALSLTQQATLLQLTTEIKEQAILQVQNQGRALQQGQNAAQARQDHYQHLQAQGMLGEEIAEMTLMGLAAVTTGVSSVLGAAAAVAAAFPQVGSPFAMTFGGQQLGPALQNSSGWTAALAKVMETSASILGIVANYKRQAEEWGLQETLAAFDVAQYQAQIDANNNQLAIAQRDLLIHQTNIAQNQALQSFYQDKFTNQALYGWLAGRLASVHFQAYSLALEFARMAQRSYQFEYRVATAFIAANYWDDVHKGLLAGEALAQSLSQLEAAAVRNGRRLQEITKIVSLRQSDPAALLRLIQTGETQFELTERMFDQDFPGQYLRRIQSVRVTIPALVGPYQNIHATLTQTANRLVLAPDLSAVRFLLGDDVDVKEGLVEHNVRPYQRISLSQGQGDSGVFDSNPASPLYLPFEQTGAISSWHLSLPKSSNLLDFNGLSDVVLEVGYTARDGGDAFRSQVANLPQLRQRDWAQLLQPALQYQSEWSRFMHGPVLNHQQQLSLTATRLVPSHLVSPEVLGLLLQLVVPADCPLGSQHPYIAVLIGDTEPVSVLPRADGTALVMLDRPLRIKAGAVKLVVSFDLRPGYTPSSLRTRDGDRLDPLILQDINLVLFLSGQVTD